MWFVYLIRAENGALYCGISTNPIKRFLQHVHGKGAKFFSLSAAQALVYVEPCMTKSVALHREHHIKQWTKQQKEILITTNSVYRLPLLCHQVLAYKTMDDLRQQQ